MVRRVLVVLGVLPLLLVALTVPADAAPRRVTLVTAGDTVAADDALAVSGLLPRGARTRSARVLVQQQTADGWQNLATARPNRRGSYGTSIVLTTPGTAVLRAVVRGARAMPSATVQVEVAAGAEPQAPATEPQAPATQPQTPPSEPAAPPASEPASEVGGVYGPGVVEWQWWNTDGDACWDAATLDLDGNGLAEDFWMDIDNDCQLDSRSWNLSGSDERHERGAFDVDENGHFEAMVAETDGVPGWDWYLVNYDNDPYWDTDWMTMWNGQASVDLQAAILGNTSVGGQATYDGWGGLVTTLAGATGQAVWPSNPDGDYCPQGDWSPADARYC